MVGLHRVRVALKATVILARSYHHLHGLQKRKCGLSTAVSVIIPTKDRREALEETIRTLLAQTRMADELIIVDQSQTESLLQTRQNADKKSQLFLARK
jgi:hypothetical protein